MALIDKLTSIANAIRSKTGKSYEMTLDQMPTEIDSIKTYVEPTIETLIISQNGTYSAPTGIDGYNPVMVNIESSDSEIEDLWVRAIERNPSKPVTKLPDSITSIGDYAFQRSTNLVITSLPDGVTSIGNYAFQNCTELALASLPSGVTSIGSYAFINCTKLALTSLPNSSTYIGAVAFQNCVNLAITSIPAGITYIRDSSFKNCTGLTEITFESTPTTITTGAFSGCTNLLTINVPWAEGVVSGAPWGATNATINYNYTGD